MVFDQFTPSRTPQVVAEYSTVFPFPTNEPLGTTDEDEDEEDDEEERNQCTRQTIYLLDGEENIFGVGLDF